MARPREAASHSAKDVIVQKMECGKSEHKPKSKFLELSCLSNRKKFYLLEDAWRT